MQRDYGPGVAGFGGVSLGFWLDCRLGWRAFAPARISQGQSRIGGMDGWSGIGKLGGINCLGYGVPDVAIFSGLGNDDGPAPISFF